MSQSDRADPIWDRAWEWIVREHQQPLDEAARAELVAWLKADPYHLRTYQEAARLWLAAAMVPPPEDPPA